MSLAGGGWSRRGGSTGGDRCRFELPPRQQAPPVVADVGCTCRAPRLLLSSLISSLKSRARGVVGVGKQPKSSAHASSSSFWSSLATAGFTSSTSITTTATTATTTAFSSLDQDHHPSWGAATSYASNAVHEVDADDAEHAARQQRRRQRRRRQDRRRRSTRGRAALGEETAVAVEVESAAPYEDFRESMAEMVREKEMYAWEDLNALLQQFLALNSPRHHPLIVAAFADLWAPRRGGPFCPPSPCLL